MMAKIQIIPTDLISSARKTREFSKATRISQVLMLTPVRGRKTSHSFFLVRHKPHLSQRRNPSSSPFLEPGMEVHLEAEQNKEEIRANPVLGACCKPHSTGMVKAGSSVRLFCHSLESRTGNEISCLMVQLSQAQGLMSWYCKHSRKEKRK